jgi:hypothetical protein
MSGCWNLLLRNSQFFFLEEVTPSVDDRLPSQLVIIDIDHSTPTDSCRTCNCQILNFKHHQKGLRQLNSLAIAETQHLIVIQNCIQILNPDCVDWPVEHEPSLVVGHFSNRVSHYFGHDSVRPLVCQHIHVPVQVVHRH